jgi:hypothetical protein
LGGSLLWAIGRFAAQTQVAIEAKLQIRVLVFEQLVDDRALSQALRLEKRLFSSASNAMIWVSSSPRMVASRARYEAFSSTISPRVHSSGAKNSLASRALRTNPAHARARLSGASPGAFTGTVALAWITMHSLRAGLSSSQTAAAVSAAKSR